MSNFETKIEPTKLDKNRVTLDDITAVMEREAGDMAAFGKSPRHRATGRLLATECNAHFLRWCQAEEKRGTEPAELLTAVCSLLAAFVGEVITLNLPDIKPGRDDAAMIKMLTDGVATLAIESMSNTRKKMRETRASPEAMRAYAEEIRRRVNGETKVDDKPS